MKLTAILFVSALFGAVAGHAASAFELFLGGTTDLRIATSDSGGESTDFGLSTAGAAGKPSSESVRPTLYLAARQSLHSAGALQFGLAGEWHSISGAVDYPQGFDVGQVQFTDPSRARLTGWDIAVGPYATWEPQPWVELEAGLFLTHQRLTLKTDIGSWHLHDTLSHSFQVARLAASWRVPVPQAGPGQEIRLRLDYTASHHVHAVNLALIAKVF